MITKLLFIAFLSLLFIVPMVLYKSQRKVMANFCLRMTAQASARKLYRLVILIMLLTFHFLYLSVQTMEIGTLVSTLAFAIFFGFMDVDKWLHRIHEKRKTFRNMVMTILILTLFPHTFSMQVTLAIIFMAALFYPSTEILTLWNNEDDRKLLIADREYLIKRYY